MKKTISLGSIKEKQTNKAKKTQTKQNLWTKTIKQKPHKLVKTSHSLWQKIKVAPKTFFLLFCQQLMMCTVILISF